jgi:hypothetical protein
MGAGEGSRRFGGLGALAGALPIAGVLVVGILLGRQQRTVSGRGTTELTDAVVVERVRAVAKLVSSETTVRDVVVYRNRWLGSTKRSLIVATGTVEAGIALDSTVRAHIDPATRTVAIVIPHARVLDVSVTRLETYDESSGLWNPFRPSDRDSIFQHVRGQLAHTAESLDVAARADSSAVRLLQALLGTDGYTVRVSFVMPVPVLAPD